MSKVELEKINIILEFVDGKISYCSSYLNNLLDAFYNEDKNIHNHKYAVIYKKIKKTENDLSNFYIIREFLQEYRKIKSYYKVEIDIEKLNELYNQKNIKEREENK